MFSYVQNGIRRIWLSTQTGAGDVSSSRAKCQLECGSQLQPSIHFTLAGLSFCFEPGMGLEQLVHEVRHFSGHR